MIVGRNKKNGYSGGRYHALLSALALAKKYKITYLTDHIPSFISDFIDYPQLRNISFDLSLFSYKTELSIKYDVILLIPDMNPFSGIYNKTLLLHMKNKGKLMLINFESPNFFNKKNKRNELNWIGWRLIAKFSQYIISSTNLTNIYAKNYYVCNSNFFYNYPPINEAVINKFKTKRARNRKKIITIITRFDRLSKHKGNNEILDFLNESFYNYTFNIIGNPDNVLKNNIIIFIQFFFNIRNNILLKFNTFF